MSTKIVLIVIAACLVAITILAVILHVVLKKKRRLKAEIETARLQLDAYRRYSSVKDEERRKTDEKIQEVESRAGARERFDAINDMLSHVLADAGTDS